MSNLMELHILWSILPLELHFEKIANFSIDRRTHSLRTCGLALIFPLRGRTLALASPFFLDYGHPYVLSRIILSAKEKSFSKK